MLCRPSVGIYYRCKKVNGNHHCGSFAVEGLATDPAMFPTAWKIAMVLMSVGIFISFLMSVMAVGSFCKQAIRKKSVFGVAGSGQGLAGKIFLLVHSSFRDGAIRRSFYRISEFRKKFQIFSKSQKYFSQKLFYFFL